MKQAQFLFVFKRRGFVPKYGHIFITSYLLLRDFCPKGFGKGECCQQPPALSRVLTFLELMRFSLSDSAPVRLLAFRVSEDRNIPGNA